MFWIIFSIYHLADNMYFFLEFFGSNSIMLCFGLIRKSCGYFTYKNLGHSQALSLNGKIFIRGFSTSPLLGCTGLDEDYSGYFSDPNDPNIPKDNEGHNLTQFRKVLEKVNPNYKSSWTNSINHNSVHKLSQKEFINELNEKIPFIVNDMRENYILSEKANLNNNYQQYNYYREKFLKCVWELSEINKFRDSGTRQKPIFYTTDVVDQHSGYYDSPFPVIRTILKERGSSFYPYSYLLKKQGISILDRIKNDRKG